MATQRPNPGYQLNNITAPVLYKVINYFMENPIRVNTFLKYPVEEIEVWILIYTVYGSVSVFNVLCSILASDLQQCSCSP